MALAVSVRGVIFIFKYGRMFHFAFQTVKQQPKRWRGLVQPRWLKLRRATCCCCVGAGMAQDTKSGAGHKRGLSAAYLVRWSKGTFAPPG